MPSRLVTLGPRYFGSYRPDIADCYIVPVRDLNARSRYYPGTQERIDENYDGSVKLSRIWYAEAHEIHITDLDGYAVYPTRTLCGTRGCMNPKHWLVAPKNTLEGDPPPMPPWWLEV